MNFLKAKSSPSNGCSMVVLTGGCSCYSHPHKVPTFLIVVDDKFSSDDYSGTHMSQDSPFENEVALHTTAKFIEVSIKILKRIPGYLFIFLPASRKDLR